MLKVIKEENNNRYTQMKDMEPGSVGIIRDNLYYGITVMRLNDPSVTVVVAIDSDDYWDDTSENTLRVELLPKGTKIVLEVL